MPVKKKPPNGRARVPKPYVKSAREYDKLLHKLELNQLETGRMLGFAGRTSRRYKRGEGAVPLSAIKLLRLMARGILTKQQVMQA